MAVEAPCGFEGGPSDALPAGPVAQRAVAALVVVEAARSAGRLDMGVEPNRAHVDVDGDLGRRGWSEMHAGILLIAMWTSCTSSLLDAIHSSRFGSGLAGSAAAGDQASPHSWDPRVYAPTRRPPGGGGELWCVPPASRRQRPMGNAGARLRHRRANWVVRLRPQGANEGLSGQGRVLGHYEIRGCVATVCATPAGLAIYHCCQYKRGAAMPPSTRRLGTGARRTMSP